MRAIYYPRALLSRFYTDCYTPASETVPKLPDPMPRLPVISRRTGGLLRFWLAGLAIAAGLYMIGRMMPATRGLLVPGYWILGAMALFFTVRWYRPRRGDRRRGDRRDQ